jgi:hypothetical protein
VGEQAVAINPLQKLFAGHAVHTRSVVAVQAVVSYLSLLQAEVQGLRAVPPKQ